MGMPTIPENFNRPTLDETIVDLLESIALEEMAIAHIMNAEGEKLQEVIKRFGSKELCYYQLQDNCDSTKQIINSLIMKEWLLLTRMNSIMEIKSNSPMKHCIEQYRN